MAARENLASQGRRREPGRQPPGVLHISRDHWGHLEGALGLSQDNRAAPFDHRKVPVRFSVDNGIQNRAETVRLPPGSPTVLLRAFYGLLRVVYGLSAVVRSHENAGKIGSSLLSTPAPARLVKTLPGPLRIVGHPTGTLRVPHGNGQNYCFYSPYGALNGYVTAADCHSHTKPTTRLRSKNVGIAVKL